MKIGQIIQFTDKAPNHHKKGERVFYNGEWRENTRSLKGLVFLIVERYYIRESGGYEYHGIELPEFPIIQTINWPFDLKYDDGGMYLWNEWRSTNEYIVLHDTDIRLAIDFKRVK